MSLSYPQSELDALAAGLTTIAVTGTNGKTSTTSMLAAIVAAAGQTPVRVTTLGMWVGDERVADDGSMPSFVRTLRRAHEIGAKWVALEVTSRALQGGFAARFPPQIAVFTNLTRDHLDRHGTAEQYLAAKAQLFVNLRPGTTAVLNAADPASALLSEVLPAGVHRKSFLPAGAARSVLPDAPPELTASAVHSDAEATRIELGDSALAKRLGGTLSLRVLGDFQADNALAAALAADAAGLHPAAIRDGLGMFTGVPGRFEPCVRQPLVVVDFAHTPDALGRVLTAARALAAPRGGRLGCVFGCGGERDQAKRPMMGEVADRLADAVWLTTDNPRAESPAAIAAMVRAGSGGRARWHEVADRRSAIHEAIRWARPADAVVVAGRGHESHQQVASEQLPFEDRNVILEAVGLVVRS